MATIDREAQLEQRRPGSGRRRWLLPAVAVGVMATAAAGYALNRDVQTTTEVSCPGNAIVDAVTGDPVADCANLWRREHGTEPPPLIAYDNQRGGIEVLPADADVPAEWTALGTGVLQDPRLIELDAALADHGDGLNARCYTPQAAQPVAESAVQRLDLAGWTVRIDDVRNGGAGTCAIHSLEPETRSVIISALEMGVAPADEPYRRLASSLQAQVDGQCVNRQEAVAAVRTIAADLGIDEAAGEVVIHSVLDAAATCSRTDVNVGGRIEVTVHGP